MRHGEAMSNVKDIVSCWPEKFKNALTKKGARMVKKAAEDLKSKSIDIVFASDLLRVKETAEIVGKILGIKPKYDKRLREIDFGTFNSGPADDYDGYFKNDEQMIKRRIPGGENYSDVSKRMASFFKEMNSKYKDKNVLIISHRDPLFLLEGYAGGLSSLGSVRDVPKNKMLHKAEIRKLN